MQMCRLPIAFAAGYSLRLMWTCTNVQAPDSICCSLYPRGSGGPVQICRLPIAFAAHYSPMALVNLCRLPRAFSACYSPKAQVDHGKYALPIAFAARYSPKAQLDLGKCADSPEHLLLAIPERLRWSWANVQTPQKIRCSLFPKGSGGPGQMCRLP